MHVQCSFIHPLLRCISKQSNMIIPRSSNLTSLEVTDYVVLNGRPDYRSDVYEFAQIRSTNLYGELKPSNADAVDIECDFHKTTLLGKLGLKYCESNYMITFTSVGPTIDFRLHHCLSQNVSYTLDLESVVVPTTVSTISGIVSKLPALYRLAYIYKTFCLESKNNDTFPLSQTVPYAAIKNLVDGVKKIKLNSNVQ